MGDASAGACLGGYLRALRLAKGASLEEMARATKISARQLDALESEQLLELPAPIFVKGFIRAYCAFLGEAPERAIELYGQLGGPVARTAAPPPGGTRSDSSWLGHPIAVSGALVVVFGLGLLALNHGVLRGPIPERSAAVRPAPPVAPIPEVPAPEPPPATVSPPATASPPASPPVVATPPAPRPAERPLDHPAASVRERPRAQHLVVTAMEPTWIRVEIDGDRVAQELLPAGSRREWSAADRFVLSVGNAGGIALELNGHALPALGPKGAVVRQLSITGPRGGS